jgi:hypothetical protein
LVGYNPPFSKNVSTNIGQTFLNIIDDEFPIGHPLPKIFNRNTVKTRKYMHAETLALLTKPLYFPNMKYLK